MSNKPKLIRMTTAAVSMRIILRGQLRYMSDYFEVVGITTPDSLHFGQISNQEGIRLIPLKMERTISPIKDFLALWLLVSMFKREKPAIVHTHTPKAGLLGMLAARITGVPVRIHTVGGMPLFGLQGLKKQIVWFTEKITYACAHAVWPNSLGLRDWMEQTGLCLRNKMYVVAHGASNGVNTGFFDPIHPDLKGIRQTLREKLQIPSQALVFSFVGRIAREKGMMELLEAYRQVKGKHQNVHIILVGLFENAHGGLSKEERIAIESEPGIHCLGRFDDVRPYLVMSDVFIFPSFREGFPNALLEAGAMGLPVIATNINGCNEIIRHGHNGILIPPQRVQELADAMDTMISDEPKRKEMSANAREAIITHFENTVIWKSMHQAYNECFPQLNVVPKA